MKKITIMGIAVGAVLTIGIFANIGLFGNNALAAQPSMEQRIKTIFWSVTNQEYGLKKIMNGMYAMKNDMKNDMQAMNDDLLQKKSFFEVKDEVILLDFGERGISINLVNCDPAIPLEKRAFHLETVGVRMSFNIDKDTGINFGGVSGLIIVDEKYQLFPLDLGFLGFGGAIDKAITQHVGASEEIFIRYVSLVNGVDLDNGIRFETVAIGQMPQGCEIEVDADDDLFVIPDLPSP